MLRKRRKCEAWIALGIGFALIASPLAAEKDMTLRLSSPAFLDGTPIPAKYTCEGQDISPPLAWSRVPDGTKSLVLIVDDPEAPDPKGSKLCCAGSISPSAMGPPSDGR
jgi:phosphatidylethanolamine-binding protein (PEBP) family uncharacterized protein